MGAGGMFPFFRGSVGRNIHVDSSGRLIATGDTTGGPLYPFGAGQFGRVCVVDSSGRLVISPLSVGLGGAGEANTASNVGSSGVGLFTTKSGVNLPFRKIVGRSPIIVHDDGAGSTLTIRTTAEANTASNIGTSGIGLFAQKSSVDLQFKKIVTGLGLRSPIVSASSVRIQESGTINRPFKELASSSGISVNLALSNNFYTNLNHNTTLTLTGPVDGGKWMFIFRNRGSNNVTFPGSVKWRGGVAPTLTTGSGSIDVITIAYLATRNIYVGDIGSNFA